MSAIKMLLMLWAALTSILVILLIYRSTLTMHEDDQLFLDEAENQLRDEQEELRRTMNRIEPYIRYLAAACFTLLLLIAGLWVYQQMSDRGV